VTSSDYGRLPTFDLSQWSNVLYLADRWGFADLREAARHAVFPLASSVDRIVLGQQYEFIEWLAPAFADLLAREEDLTLEEAERLGMQTMVTIAKGRLRARQIQHVRPMETIHALVTELFSTELTQESETLQPALTGDLSPEEEHQVSSSDPVEAHIKLEVDDAASTRSLMKVWMDQCSKDEERSDAVSSITGYLAANPSHALHVVEGALDHLWANFEAHWKANIEQKPEPKYKGSELRALTEIRCAMSATSFDTFLKSYCLKRIGNWNELLHESVIAHDSLVLATWTKDQSLDRFSRSFLDMITATRLTRHIIDSNLVDESVLSKSTLDEFWTKMEHLFKLMWSSVTPAINIRLMTIINLFDTSAFVAGPAIEHFYSTSETQVGTWWGDSITMHASNLRDLESANVCTLNTM
jgi:hypothetical protein